MPRTSIAFAIIVMAALVSFQSPASSDEISDTLLSREFEQLVAGAEPCGYNLDEKALSAFAENVIAQLSSSVRSSTDASGWAMKNQLKNASRAEKIAQCAVLRGLARKYGFLP